MVKVNWGRTKITNCYAVWRINKNDNKGKGKDRVFKLGTSVNLG